MAAHEQGQLYLSHLRGRCCYEKVVQAADYFLRQETGALDGASYRLVDFHQIEGDAHWIVRFREPASGRIHQLTLALETAARERLVSCSPFMAKAVPSFRLVAPHPAKTQPPFP